MNKHTEYKFSVIIPVYNVESYLRQCLDSVLNQTYSNYEVICIEDVSTDHSLDILQEYQFKIPMKILVNDKNSGLSYARNRGMDVASGEYILFLDSDDYISYNLLETLAEELKTENYDFLTFDSKMFYDAGAGHTLTYNPIRKNQYPEIYKGQELYMLQSKKGDYKATVWQYCYNKCFLQENNLRFVVGRYNEDEEFSFYTFMNAKRIKVLSKTLHYYRVRNGSIMSPDKIPERLLDNIDSYMDYIHFYLENKGLDPNLEECVQFQVDNRARNILANFSQLTYDKRVLFEKSMRNDLQRLFMREILSRSKKKIFCKEAAQQLETHEKIYVYGAGKYAKKVIQILDGEEIQLQGILVSNADKNPEEYCRYKVYECEKVKEQLPGALIIVGVSEKNSAEIIDNLKKIEAVDILECKYLFV